MAYPEGLTLITVTGQVAGIVDADEAYVTFFRPVWLQGPTPGVLVASGSEVAYCDSDGEFSIDLPATNDPAWAPVGWSYSVGVYRSGAINRGTMQLPYDGGPVDLADVFQPDETPQPGVSYALAPALTDLTGRVTALEEAPGGTAPAWTAVTGKPTVFPPEDHTHSITDVTALQDGIDALDLDINAVEARVDALEAAPGGGTAATFARARITAGSFDAPAEATLTPVPGLTLSLAAAAGDNVELAVNCLLDVTGGGGEATDFYDLVILVDDAIAATSSSGDATGAVEGDPALYPSASTRFRGTSATWSLTLDAGHIDAGVVTFALAHKGDGDSTVLASATFPFRWSIRNDHQ